MKQYTPKKKKSSQPKQNNLGGAQWNFNEQNFPQLPLQGEQHENSYFVYRHGHKTSLNDAFRK